MTEQVKIGATDILLVVDVQNDFCPGGQLAVPGGGEIVPLVNRIAKSFQHVVLTQDWHPRGHLSFASAHPGKKPFETVMLPYGPQVLWPGHCIQGTTGAGFHPGLKIPHAELILRKGYHPEIDSYSAFFENDRATPTGLAGYLRERGFERVFCAGLTLDFCVRYTAEDAGPSGFRPIIIEDACRAIDAQGSLDAGLRSFAERGIPRIASEAICAASA